MRLFKGILLKLKKKKSSSEKKEGVKYIHPTRDMTEWTDDIIKSLNAAIVIAEKMKRNSCEVEQFKMYKRMFRDVWADIACPYNNIDQVDVDECSDKRYIA